MYIYIHMNPCCSQAVSAVLWVVVSRPVGWVVDREDLPVLHVRLPGGDDAAEAAEALGGVGDLLLVLALLLLDETWSPESRQLEVVSFRRGESMEGIREAYKGGI